MEPRPKPHRIVAGCRLRYVNHSGAYACNKCRQHTHTHTHTHTCTRRMLYAPFVQVVALHGALRAVQCRGWRQVSTEPLVDVVLHYLRCAKVPTFQSPPAAQPRIRRQVFVGGVAWVVECSRRSLSTPARHTHERIPGQ